MCATPTHNGARLAALTLIRRLIADLVSSVRLGPLLRKFFTETP